LLDSLLQEISYIDTITLTSCDIGLTLNICETQNVTNSDGRNKINLSDAMRRRK